MCNFVVFQAPRILLASQKPNLNQSFTSDFTPEDIELISPLSTPTNKKLPHYFQQDHDMVNESMYGKLPPLTIASNKKQNLLL